MKQDQNSYFYDLKKSRSGQAVIEFVLLLVVIVGLILGAAKVFGAIDRGMQKYIGDYFVCLMEYGELPTLGVSNADLKKHTGGSGRKCDDQFESFTFESGRPAVGGGDGSNNANNGNNSGKANGGKGKNGDGRGGKGSGSTSNNDRNSNNSNEDDTSGGSDLAGRGRNGSGSSRKGPDVRRSDKGFGTLDGGQEESNVKVIEEDGESDSDKEKRRRRRPKRTQIGYADEYRAIGGKALQEIEKAQRRRGAPRKPTSTVLKIDADGGPSGPTRKTVTPPQRDVAAEYKDRDAGFSFGSLFKWLIIAGIVVAILVFFGGQLLNYSNSD